MIEYEKHTVPVKHSFEPSDQYQNHIQLRKTMIHKDTTVKKLSYWYHSILMLNLTQCIKNKQQLNEQLVKIRQIRAAAKLTVCLL